MFTAEQQTNDAEDAAAFISVLRFSAHESEFSLFHLQPSSLSFRGCTQKFMDSNFSCTIITNKIEKRTAV
jgi:hypothetical protein